MASPSVGLWEVTVSAEPGSAPTGPPSKLRQMLTFGWVTTIVAFTIARFFVAKGTLEEYGLNLWVFGFIDLVTAVPYALGVAHVVGALVDRQPARASRWGAVALISFLAPYLYVGWAGRGGAFPTIVWVALGLLVLLFGGNAARTVRRRVIEGRAARAAFSR